MGKFKDIVRSSYNILTRNLEAEIGVSATGMGDGGSDTGSYYRRDSTTSVLAPVLVRIAMDGASIPIHHVRVDSETRAFTGIIHSELESRINGTSNVDQNGTAFRQKLVHTILSEGVAAVIPVDLSHNPFTHPNADIWSWRVGVIKDWYTKSVAVEYYSDVEGNRVTRILPKRFVAIIYNPLARIMNSPNSTLTRLKEKYMLLDNLDAQTGSSKLDLILQMPFSVAPETRKLQAALRKEILEQQLYDSKYGIAYIGANEKVTQLNRAVENTLPTQIEYLTDRLYMQLGLTPNIFSGEATPEQMVGYYSRTINPIIVAIVEGMRESFLSKTARTQGQDIRSFPRLFQLSSIEAVSEAADKFTRNEIMSSNEFRDILGLKKSVDPKSDALKNKNITDKSSTQKPSPIDGQAE